MYKLQINEEEKRLVEDPARADWGLEMLDAIVPSLQDVGKNVLPTLPSLSQEGKRLEVGALGLNLYLLVGGQVKDPLLYSLQWPCHLGNQLVITSGSGWMPRDNFIHCLNRRRGPAKGFD